MIYEPHEYQRYAIKFIEEHPVATVFLECGMGKSSITLTAINSLMYDSFQVHKVLIIAPKRVAQNSWPEELEKWDHLKDLRYSVAVGTETERIEALKADADIYIINRENVPWLVKSLPFNYDMVVVDELSSFKNHKAQRFKALMQVRPRVKRIVGLTGTPASNGLMDLFAEFKLLDMGERLGFYISRYRDKYFKPDKMNGHIVYSYKALPDSEEKIYETISDITVSMKALDHLQMPELISNQYKVRMAREEESKYRALKKDLVLSLNGEEITAANAAALTGKLLQMANGAVYTDDTEALKLHDHKLDALEDLIEAANGKPLLVAYWFKHDLERIEERLTKLKIDSQRISSVKSINDWNAGKVAVGLIHPASAGHGLNLQRGGNHLVWFGLTWSLELYQQTNARLYRQGQRNDSVVITHIVTAGTIDEQILRALEEKDKTQTRLIDAVKAEIKIKEVSDE